MTDQHPYGCACSTCMAQRFSPMTALAQQEGGSHYKDMPLQPVEFIHKNGIGFIEGCVIKYVVRHKQKGGAQDIRKAIHFLQMLLEMEYPQ